MLIDGMSGCYTASSTGAQAFEAARAVTSTWWGQSGPVEKRAWPGPASRLRDRRH